MCYVYSGLTFRSEVRFAAVVVTRCTHFYKITAFPPLSSPDKSGGARHAEKQCRSLLTFELFLMGPDHASAPPRLSRSTLPPSCAYDAVQAAVTLIHRPHPSTLQYAHSAALAGNH